MSNCVTERMMGEFCVSQKMIRDHPDKLADLFAETIIVKAEYAVHPGCTVNDIRYCAYSVHFDQMDKHDLRIPEYELVFENDHFAGFRKLQSPAGRAEKKIAEQAELIKEMLLLIAKTPWSKEDKDLIDVEKVEAFLKRHEGMMN